MEVVVLFIYLKGLTVAKLIQAAVESPVLSAIHTIPISASINRHVPAARQTEIIPNTPPADTSAPRSLKSADKRLGPMRIGEFMISRAELKSMGAKVNGQDISPANSLLKIPDQAFLDALSFDPAKVQARIRSTDTPDSSRVATLFFELACKRSVSAGPVFVAVDPIAPDSPMLRFEKLVDSAQKIDLHHVASYEHMPTWINKSKSYLQSGAGVGLQAYGIYSGLIGMVEAMKTGDIGEAVLNGGGIASELGSMIIEQGLNKGGAALFNSGGSVFKRFPATTLGKTLSRGSGLFASVITLPFDIIGAVNAFNAAAGATGKTAQDHYVSGALNVAGAGLSLALGMAALAGFGSVAGPLGLAAAAVLILGAEIYRAARVVDDIDDYIELSFHERLRSGWFAFTHQELDQSVMDRFKSSKLLSDHGKQLHDSAKYLLEGPYKNIIEHVVSGSFKVELRPVKVWKYQWDERAGEKPFQTRNEPVVVDSDDIIDARDGLPAELPHIVSGEPGEGKGVFWRLGGGHDRIVGVNNTANHFAYGADAKAISGGEKNDTFQFNVPEQELDRRVRPAHISTLDGGAGNDTLTFHGERPTRDTRQTGYKIDLQSGHVALRSGDPALDELPMAHLRNIENVSTLLRGASQVTGNDEANVIAANGNDHVAAGAGDDNIIIRGAHCRVDGGAGADRYYIAESSTDPTIIEDGQQTSLIEFGWPMAQIQQWQIVGSALIATSRQGEDGELPEHRLTLDNVYSLLDGQRTLHNNLLLFSTSDEYELLPILPATLPGDQPINLEVIVTRDGHLPPAPYTVNGGAIRPTAQAQKHYFVSRSERSVDFMLPAAAAKTSSVIYLDHDSNELRETTLTYHVDLTPGAPGYSALHYSQFNLLLQLASRSISISEAIGERSAPKHNTGAGLMAAGVEARHEVLVVFRDGTSYRVVAPYLSYIADAAEPGDKSRDGRECLKHRHGNYPFSKPRVAETHLMPATPHRVNIDSIDHRGTYVLQGQSSAYDVYPSSNMTIHLSTPAALAKTANASTWTIYTSHLEETVSRDDISLDADELSVGSVLFKLPTVDEETPVESISVATSNGNLYEVSLLFEVLQLYVVDARSYTSVEALMADLDRAQQRNELAGRVHVVHIKGQSPVTGALFYNSLKKYWGIDGDPQARINPEDLQIIRAITA